MSNLKSIISSLTTTAFVLGLALNFNACMQETPLESTESTPMLAKPGVKEYTYPMTGAYTFRFVRDEYRGGEIILENGSNFDVTKGALTPPPEIPWGEDVTVTMTLDKDETKNELIYTFGPSGCSFDPAVWVKLKYDDLNIETPKLYYIDSNGQYILQTPDYINLRDKWLNIRIDHFSRYAIGME